MIHRACDHVRAIALGLAVTGRAEPAGERIRLVDGYVRLERLAGGFFWISDDAAHLLRGEALVDAEELQPEFLKAMERAGLAASRAPTRAHGVS